MVGRVGLLAGRVARHASRSLRSRTCRGVGPDPTGRVVGRVELCRSDRGRPTSRTGRRVEYAASAEESVVGPCRGDTSNHGLKGGVYCRTLSERQVDLSLRLYNSSRSASRRVWTRLELAHVSRGAHRDSDTHCIHGTKSKRYSIYLRTTARHTRLTRARRTSETRCTCVKRTPKTRLIICATCN